MKKHPADIFKTFWKEVRRVTSLGRTQDVNFEPLIQMHFQCIFFNFFFTKSIPETQKRVTCFIVVGFWKVLKTSYNGSKVTPGDWRSRNVPRKSILNISTKRISVVIFSVLVHQLCVLETKKLVIAHSFRFGEPSYERPKNVLKWQLQRDAVGRLRTSI